MMEQYFALAGLPHSSPLLVFHSITHTKHSEHLRVTEGLSYMYTCMRELLVGKWRELWFATNHLGLLSFRAGVASAAANEEMPDHLFEPMVIGGQIQPR